MPTDAAPRAVVSPASRAVQTIRTAPLATAVVVAMVATGAATGTLFSATAGRSALVESLSYGLPDIARPLTFLTGALLVPRPELYLVMAALAAVVVGFVERRAGAWRTLLVLLATHLVGTVGTAAVLAGGRRLAWPWAQGVATQTDTGLSAGLVGVLLAGTVLLSPVWRARIRLAVGGYLILMLLRSGLLWDAEHLIGGAAGLALGPLLRRGSRPASAKPVSAVAPRRARIRGTLALGVVLLPVSSVVLACYPGYDGIFGPGPQAGTVGMPLVPALLQLAIAVVIGKALRHGLPGGWWAAVLFTSIPVARELPAVLIVHQPLRIGELICWGAPLAALIALRGCWPLRLPLTDVRRHAARLVLATAAFAGVWWLVLTLASGGDTPRPRPRDIMRQALFTHVEAHSEVGRFLFGLTHWLWAVALVMLLLPVIHNSARFRGSGTPRERLESLLRNHGGGSIGWQRTWPGFDTWLTRDRQVAISYRPVAGVAIALGDPVGPRERWLDAVAEFRRFCVNAGWTPCWYAVTPAFAATCGSRWTMTQIGEDAVLPLADLEFRGKAWQDVRTARNHAAKAGIRMQRVDVASCPAGLAEQIHAVCQGWVAEKPLPEMGFTLGTVELAGDGAMRTHVAIDESGVVHGVTTWMPVHDGGRIVGWTIDVMRRRTDGFRGVIEFLIAESALAFRDEGAATISLSVAPLARTGQAGGGLDRVLDVISRVLEPVYGFRSLLDFKRKFHPEFTPVYLGYLDEIDLSEITIAISKAYLPHLTLRQSLRVLRTLCTRRGTGRAEPHRPSGMPSGAAPHRPPAGRAAPVAGPAIGPRHGPDADPQPAATAAMTCTAR